MPNYDLAGFDDLTAEELQLLDNLNSAPGEPVPPVRRFVCRHIHADGYRCGSPCLRGEEFCYYHHASRPPVSKPIKRKSRRATLALPLIEDHASLQAAVNHVLQSIAGNQIDPSVSGRLLYGLQIADTVLRGAAFHNPRKMNDLDRDFSGDTRHAHPAQSTLPNGPVEQVVLHPTLGEIALRTEIPATQPAPRLEDEDDAPAPLWDISANQQPQPNRKEEVMPQKKGLARLLREQMDALEVRNIIEFGADGPEDEAKVAAWKLAQLEEQLTETRSQLEQARAATAAAELALAESKRVIVIYHDRWLREKNRNAPPQPAKSQPAKPQPATIREIQAVAAIAPPLRCRATSVPSRKFMEQRNLHPRLSSSHRNRRSRRTHLLNSNSNPSS